MTEKPSTNIGSTCMPGASSLKRRSELLLELGGPLRTGVVRFRKPALLRDTGPEGVEGFGLPTDVDAPTVDILAFSFLLLFLKPPTS